VIPPGEHADARFGLREVPKAIFQRAVYPVLTRAINNP